MISRKDVEHIARLARIELTEEEKTKLEKDLRATLEFVEKLNEVNTDSVEPAAGGTELLNITRGDKEKGTEFESRQAEMLAQAPDKKDTWIKVKSVFE